MIRNFWPACIIFFYVFSCNIIEVNRFCIVLLYCYIMLLHFHKQMFLSNRLILLFHCLNLCCYFNINLFFLWSLYDFFLLVWFWHYLIPSGFSCYKLHIFSHISIVFPNAAWLISLKNLFQNHFLYFFFLALCSYQCMVLTKLLDWTWWLYALFSILIHDLVLEICYLYKIFFFTM